MNPQSLFCSRCHPRHRTATLALALCLFNPLALVAAGTVDSAASAEDRWSLDYRFAPPNWQTAICLPDDWQKTLVARDGGLLYDYPGKFSGFGLKITFEIAGDLNWVSQELAGPRVPIVATRKRLGAVEIEERAFAVAPPLPPIRPTAAPALALERVGASSGIRDWAQPGPSCDPGFRHVAVGWNNPLAYRFPAKPGERFTVVFGICEGYHTNAGARVLDLQVEGRSRRQVDAFKDKGRNVPAAYPIDAQDENNDGFIDLAVAAAPGSPDNNTILNVLWVFRAGQAPSPEALIQGGPLDPAPLLRIACGVDKLPTGQLPRHDVLLVTLRNTADHPVKLSPRLTIETDAEIWSNPYDNRVRVGDQTQLAIPSGWVTTDRRGGPVLASLELPARAERTLVFGVARGDHPVDFPKTVAEAKSALKKAEKYWRQRDLPYDRITLPDPNVQALLDSSIRNIYQAREIKQGLPAFQVGPTCYRGLWVVDGSFLLEAITYLGRADETRAGITYLLNFQRDDGSFMLIDGHWKETGIVLWAVTRHAQLTGDTDWLRSVWPRLERAMAYIKTLRGMPPKGAPNEGLIPDGFSDGGLAEKVPEYTNIYWTLAGMRAAVEAADGLGRTDQANAWRNEYDDFRETFRRAAERDRRADAQGNPYLPIRMARGEGIPPQKAQWAFLHAVYPGQIFAPDDPLVQGNMAMLRSVEREGLVFDTGWLKNGLWNYFGSFYAHAWLWLGDGQKAAETLYAFGNHASPLLCWREEHMPQGQGEAMVGDMPHNWASAEFIRLIRHCLVLERGRELHLFAGFPAAWAKPGALTRMDEIATRFGPVSFEFKVNRDGTAGQLRFTPPRRDPPDRILWHVAPWSGEGATTIELPTTRTTKRSIPLGVGPE